MNTSLNFLRQLSTKDFVAFGLDNLAYVKPVELDGTTQYSIHAADGTPLTVVAERAVAFAAVRQHDMEPVSVH